MTKFDADVIGFILLLGVVGGLYRFTHEPAIRSSPYVASITASSAEASPFSLLEKPRALPELHFFNGNGASLTLAAFHGKAVLLNIWAPWCVPCRKEMPTLGRLQAKLGGEGFEVIALSVDQRGPAAVRAFYSGIGIRSLSVYVDPSGYAVRDLNLVGIPTTLLIDRDGRELARAIGPAEWDSAGTIETIRRYLFDAPGVSDAGGDGSSTTADDLRRRQWS
jgi:thiol-disulfide isomerase/thioredoxin